MKRRDEKGATKINTLTGNHLYMHYWQIRNRQQQDTRLPSLKLSAINNILICIAWIWIKVFIHLNTLSVKIVTKIVTFFYQKDFLSIYRSVTNGELSKILTLYPMLKLPRDFIKASLFFIISADFIYLKKNVRTKEKEYYLALNILQFT